MNSRAINRKKIVSTFMMNLHQIYVCYHMRAEWIMTFGSTPGTWCISHIHSAILWWKSKHFVFWKPTHPNPKLGGIYKPIQTNWTPHFKPHLWKYDLALIFKNLHHSISRYIIYILQISRNVSNENGNVEIITLIVVVLYWANTHLWQNLASALYTCTCLCKRLDGLPI